MKKSVKKTPVIKKKLDKQQYHVLREGGTESPFTGKLLYNKEEGIYRCAGCGAPLFSSDSKFESGTGWPSFDKPITPGAVHHENDSRYGMTRTEIICAHCRGHLGHVFDDGPTDTGKRFCLNSCALDFKKKATKKS